MEWDGAELCFYVNGESHTISLSETQFAVILKILGIEYNENNNLIETKYFSDATLIQLTKMKGNPFNLKEFNKN